jgi:hypothetical protein
VLVELEGELRRLPATDFPDSLDVAAAADKLRRYAGPIPEARIAQLIELVERVEALDDVSQLAGAIAG